MPSPGKGYLFPHKLAEYRRRGLPGASMLRAFILGLLFLGIQVTFTTTFQALGKGTAAMIISLGRQLLFYVPALYLLDFLFGFNGFIFVLPVADVCTALLALLLGIPLVKILR
jgi:Na+-driven multidrug efflux pump